MKYKKALLVVDAPRGGKFAGPGEDKAALALNTCIRQFARKGLPVFFLGTRFSSQLAMPKRKIVLFAVPGRRPDNRLVFEAEDAAGLDLLSMLKIFGVQEVYVGGMPTDRRIIFFMRDALKKGFKAKFLRVL